MRPHPNDLPIEDQLRDSACTRCNRRRLCEHVEQSMKTLETKPHAVVNLRLCRTRKFLRKRLDSLGFRYPISPKLCLFSQMDANHARRILFKAKDLCMEWDEVYDQEDDSDLADAL